MKKKGGGWHLSAIVAMVLAFVANGHGAVNGTVLDDVAPDSLAGWIRVSDDAKPNPVVDYSEVNEGYQGSLAIKGNCTGDTTNTCEHRSINKTYDIGAADTNASWVELFYQASVGAENVLRWTYIAVTLLDGRDQPVGGMQRYYLPDGMGTGANLADYHSL